MCLILNHFPSNETTTTTPAAAAEYSLLGESERNDKRCQTPEVYATQSDATRRWMAIVRSYMQAVRTNSGVIEIKCSGKGLLNLHLVDLKVNRSEWLWCFSLGGCWCVRAFVLERESSYHNFTHADNAQNWHRSLRVFFCWCMNSKWIWCLNNIWLKCLELLAETRHANIVMNIIFSNLFIRISCRFN